VLLSAAAVSAQLALTAHLGGQVRHTEIRTKISRGGGFEKGEGNGGIRFLPTTAVKSD